MYRFLRFLWLVAVAFGGWPPASSATIVAPVDLVELTRAARVVARGRVVSVTAQWADGRRRVETLVTIEVGAYLKGDFGPRVTVRVPGGDLGRYRSVMPGAPRFAEGESVVVFLDGQAPSVPHLVGFAQGVFRVRRDPETGRSLVTPAPLLAGGHGAGRVIRGDAERAAPDLATFERDVRAIAAGRLPPSVERERRGAAPVRRGPRGDEPVGPGGRP